MRWRSLGRGAVGMAALLGLAACGGGEDLAEDAELARSGAALVSTATFGAVADARVEAAAPTTNFGSSRTLMADLSPQSQSYLRFSVTGVSGTVTRAVVRLYAAEGSSDGPRLFLAAGGWGESTVNWNNRPAPLGSALGDKGAVSSGTWMEYDVTSAVKGNGELNVVLVATSSDGTDVASRQADSAGQRPQLVVTTDSGTPPPPTSSCGDGLVQELAIPLGDATIAQDQPTTNFGNLDNLVADFSPLSEVWLGFETPYHLEGTRNVVKATLRLYAYDGSSDGPALYEATFFDEGSITWSSHYPGPRTQAPVDNKAAITANTWVEYDVTSAVVRPDSPSSSQYVAFTLASGSTDATRFYSRQASDARLRPQLVLTRKTGCTYRGTGGALTGFRQYGAEGAERVLDTATDRQGGTVVLGRTEGSASFGGTNFPTTRDFVLARYDATGAHLWSRSYHAPAAGPQVFPKALTVTPEGMLLVVGHYSGAPDFGTGPLPAATTGPLAMFIAKFAPDGRPMWSRGFIAYQQRFGEPEPSALFAHDVTTDSTGSLIVVGESYGTVDLGGGELPGGRSSTEDTPGLVLARFRWDGAHLWSTGIEPGGCLSGVVGTALATDSAGNIVVGGRTCQTAGLGGSGPETPFVMRYSPDGVRQWVRHIDGVFGLVNDVAVGAGDAVHFAGNFRGRATFAGQAVSNSNPDEGYEGDPDLMVGTYRADGSEAWVRDLPGAPGYATASRLAVDGAGRLAVVGQVPRADLGGGELAAGSFLARYSPTGAHLWSRSFPGVPYAGSVSVQPSGNVVLGFDFLEPFTLEGRSFTSSGQTDVLLLQFAP